MDTFGKLMLALCAVPVSALMRGLTFSLLGLWFMVPLGLPEIGVVHALGMAMTIAFVAKNNSADSSDTGLGIAIATEIVGCLIVILFGAIVYWAM